MRNQERQRVKEGGTGGRDEMRGRKNKRPGEREGGW